MPLWGLAVPAELASEIALLTSGCSLRSWKTDGGKELLVRVAQACMEL